MYSSNKITVHDLYKENYKSLLKHITENMKHRKHMVHMGIGDLIL